MEQENEQSFIEKYMNQLRIGCGRVKCNNRYCASSSSFYKANKNLDDAASEANLLFSLGATLCDSSPIEEVVAGPSGLSTSYSTPSTSYMPAKASVERRNMDERKTMRYSQTSTLNTQTGTRRKQIVPTEGNKTVKIDQIKEEEEKEEEKEKEDRKEEKDLSISDETSTPNEPQIQEATSVHTAPPPSTLKAYETPLTEHDVYKLCDESIQTRTPKPLIDAFNKVFSNLTVFGKCFHSKVSDHNNTGGSNTTQEGTSDKSNDTDNKSASETFLDLISCRRAFQYLAKKVPRYYYRCELITLITTLGARIDCDLKFKRAMSYDAVNCLAIALEIQNYDFRDYYEVDALRTLCNVAEHLPVKDQANLARLWAHQHKEGIRGILNPLHQVILLRTLPRNSDYHYLKQNDECVISAAELMKILYYANILAGVVEISSPEERITVNQDDLLDLTSLVENITSLHLKNSEYISLDDPLANELNIDVLDSVKPYIPFNEFYNKHLSEYLVAKEATNLSDCRFDLSNEKRFTFLKYPFMLTTTYKSLGLCYEGHIRVYLELLLADFRGIPMSPYLCLKLRRTHLIEDTLMVLERVARQNPVDLKKALVIQFPNEPLTGHGTRKEFFHMICGMLCNPKYCMFRYQMETNTLWFNLSTTVNDALFNLMGTILGLALYNTIIIPIDFPMVMYKKLMGKKGTYEDLADWSPFLYKGLKYILEYEGDDLEATLIQTFRIIYEDGSGNIVPHDLKENGDKIFVTQDNKREFVTLYVDFLLNKSVERQFKAMRHGFLSVIQWSPIWSLFRPDELETLLCGKNQLQ
ncbi:ubiquitin-protein ligase E3A-like isoform X2 [Galleria mellonella]|uniref:HECT-type E3 ubiquitin transferase n=1 Tax=Galleria mellonella TaxID=7137 RepID=A0A6J3C490_GALME|nr:ubiquitin-protein ligase E3A-like isoform X2 [Galleria mellonella]